ncbi:hypothetical protein [Rubrobacter indicoceani]|uniref:hypothetical protein n=1 Tax=Rubrobacter indicoceani TaxID=2051957 RepID=UPI0013C46DC9|nr:hypothetical protein [Rubrobacter indicoceani]
MSQGPGSFRKLRVIERLILAVILLTVAGTGVVACTQFSPASDKEPAGSSVAAPQPREPATDPDAVDDMKAEMRREADEARNTGTAGQPEANQPGATRPTSNGNPANDVDNSGDADAADDPDDDLDDRADDTDDADDLDNDDADDAYDD